MGAIVESVLENSIAEELEIKKGDEIVSIDGIVLRDLIDYTFLTASENLVLLIKKTNGDEEEIELEKDFDENLGIIFESAVFDKIKLCANNCIFCFVDQQPKGLRPSLYVKDDDFRLSFLQGTYITLTNLTKKDRTRIVEQNLAPLYVSVHTTNGELRAKMLNNKRAANIKDDLKWFNENNIPIHAQIVLCPNYNDGIELEKTLNDLAELKKNILSIAIVPLGLTQFRKIRLKSVSAEVAKNTIMITDNFNKRIKRNLACVADEFFLIVAKNKYTNDKDGVKIELPPKEYYGDFSQLEDGVGTLRMLLDDFDKREKRLPKRISERKLFNLVTGEAIRPFFEVIAERLNEIENLNFRTNYIKSNFWGEDVNVTGLVVGTDIIKQLKPIKDEIANLIIPSVMLKPMSETFLDGLTITDIKKELSCEIHILKDFYTTEELINYIIK